MASRYKGRLVGKLGIGGEGQGNMNVVPTAKQSRKIRDRMPALDLSAQLFFDKVDTEVGSYFRDDEPIIADTVLRHLTFDRQKLSRQAPPTPGRTRHIKCKPFVFHVVRLDNK